MSNEYNVLRNNYNYLLNSVKHHNMRALTYHRNLPAIIDRKSTHRNIKAISTALNPSLIVFKQTQELILNTEALPLTVAIELAKDNCLYVFIAPTNVTVKHRLENRNIPINLGSVKWLKLTLGEEINKVEVKAQNNQNKFGKGQVYNSTQSWKNDEKVEKLGLTEFTLQPILQSLRNKLKIQQKHDQKQGKNNISNYLKSKMTERANSFCYKPKLSHIKNRQVLISRDLHEKQVHQDEQLHLNGKKYDSETLDFNGFYDNKDIIGKRQVNTSNSVRSDSNELRFTRKLTRFRNKQQIKHQTGPIQQSANFIVMHCNKPKPRFYQQISLTHQEIQLKRKKFDSQFISKKLIPNNINNQQQQKINNQSEVKEQICKMEGSKQDGHLQDTLQRGIFNNQANNPNNEESGTLCQSVYQ